MQPRSPGIPEGRRVPALRALGAAVALALAMPAYPALQTVAPDVQVGPVQRALPSPVGIKTLETVVVTGTHIRGVDLETEHPLQVLTREDIVRTGLTGIADIVQSLIVANGQTQNRNINNGNDGRQLVNLRSLGANRTLVLVNGQRWVSAVDGAVDLSAIPFALVQRIEVLKDGASAIYGSDAIGGVINIITRPDFERTAIGAYVGETDHGDGLRREADFAFGRSGDRWNGSFGLEYGKDDAVMAGARTISSVPVAGLPLAATGSAANQYGVFRVPALYKGPRTLIPGRPGTSPDDFRMQDNAIDDNYDFVRYNYLQTPQERRAGFGQFRWQFSPTLAFNADVLFNQRRSAEQLAPPVVFFSALFLPPGNPQAFGVSAQNLYNPFGVPVPSMNTRWPDSDPRRFEQTVDTARYHLGLNGSFEFLARTWDWSADATRTRAVQTEFGTPYADNDRLQLGLGPSFRDAGGVVHCGTPDAVIAGCVPIDLFTGPGRLTPAMLDYVDVDVTDHTYARSDALHFNITSVLADLVAGPLGFAAGVERRLERGSEEPDWLVSSGRANSGGAVVGPTAGAYAVNEAYVEFDVPLLHDRPLARQLDINLATRWSDYSLFGSTDNSRVGLRWKPLDDLMVRSTWSQGFRAPTIFEAFGGIVDGLPGDATDICAKDGRYVPPPAVAANCLARGVPANVEPPFFTIVASGGNPALKPETSRSLTAGFVYSPAWLGGVDLSVDWYRIRIRNAIGNPGAQFFVDGCYKHNDPVACTHITRLPTGELAHVLAINENLPGGIETDGVDFGLAWKHATRYGEFNLRWESAYVDYWGPIGKPPYGSALPDGSLSPGNVAGANTPDYGVIWRLRSVATLAWQRGAHGAAITGRYFSAIKEDCSYVTYIADIVRVPSLSALCSDPNRVVNGVPEPRNRVGAVTYVDLETSWIAPWSGRFALGMRNAFDRDPPVSYTYANSFYPDYDIPGRFLYLSYRQRFR